MAVSRDSLLLQLADLCEEGPVRRVRGVGVAAGLEWLSVLPEGPETDAVIDDLLAVTDRACKALAAG